MFLKHIDGALRPAFLQQNAPSTMNLLGQKVALKADRLRFLSALSERSSLDKAWEISRGRLFSITGITYVTMVLVFIVFGSSRPFVDALEPAT